MPAPRRQLAITDFRLRSIRIAPPLSSTAPQDPITAPDITQSIENNSPVLVNRLNTGNLVHKAFFSIDGRRIITVSSKSVKICSVDGAEEFEIEHPEPVEHAEISRDGALLVTWCVDGTGMLWSIAADEEPWIIRKFRTFGVPSRVKFMDGKITTWGREGWIRCWKLPTPGEVNISELSERVRQTTRARIGDDQRFHLLPPEMQMSQ